MHPARPGGGEGGGVRRRRIQVTAGTLQLDLRDAGRIQSHKKLGILFMEELKPPNKYVNVFEHHFTKVVAGCRTHPESQKIVGTWQDKPAARLTVICILNT